MTLQSIRQFFCFHQFSYADIILRTSPGGGVTWPCCKCGKVFKEHCGLDVLEHGTLTKTTVLGDYTGAKDDE